MKEPKPKTIQQLQADLQSAREAFARSQNYHTATHLQRAQDAVGRAAEGARKGFRVIQGDNNNHDLSDVEICGEAMKAILGLIHGCERDDQIIGTMLMISKISHNAVRGNQ